MISKFQIEAVTENFEHDLHCYRSENHINIHKFIFTIKELFLKPIKNDDEENCINYDGIRYAIHHSQRHNFSKHRLLVAQGLASYILYKDILNGKQRRSHEEMRNVENISFDVHNDASRFALKMLMPAYLLKQVIGEIKLTELIEPLASSYTDQVERRYAAVDQKKLDKLSKQLKVPLWAFTYRLQHREVINYLSA